MFKMRIRERVFAFILTAFILILLLQLYYAIFRVAPTKEVVVPPKVVQPFPTAPVIISPVTDPNQRLYLEWGMTEPSATLIRAEESEGGSTLKAALFKHASSDRPSSFPFVSGDSIRSFCDILFDETTDMDVARAAAVKERDLVFVKTDLLGKFFDSVFAGIKSRFILVSHNADHSSPGPYAKFLDDDRIIAWFGQNPDARHLKYHPIPIGFANGHWPHGNLEASVY